MNKGKTYQDAEEAQAQIDIWRFALGFTEMAVVKCAIELGIADVLETHKAPVTLTDLSSSLGCSPSALYRIMRFLTHRRIFKEIATETYDQTPLSRLLLRNNEKSMADLILLESSPVMLDPFIRLRGRVLSDGSPAFDASHGGDDIWRYTEKNPGHGKLFDDGMACDAKVGVSSMIEGCPEVFNGIKSMVDVGGGNGATMEKLIEACPWICRGINFDLPHVVAVAPERPGVEHVGGDMFKSVPKVDVVFLKRVLHDWGDEECIQILKNCKQAIPKETGKVIIVEAVVDEGDSEDKFKDIVLMLDMVIMAHTTNGKERTCKEWAYVLNEAGFSHYTVRRIHSTQSVIEAYP